METATLNVRSRPAGSTQDSFTPYAVNYVKFLMLTDEELQLVGGALVAHQWRRVLSWEAEHEAAGAPAPKVSDVWARADGTEWTVKSPQVKTLETRYSSLCQMVPRGA